MQRLAQLAGFFAACGIRALAHGPLSAPLLGFEGADGCRRTVELGDRASAQDRRVMMAGTAGASRGVARAVLIVGASINLPAGQTDALIVEAVTCGPHPHSLKIAIPFHTMPGTGQLAVDQPSLLSHTGALMVDPADVIRAFIAGVTDHLAGTSTMNAHTPTSPAAQRFPSLYHRQRPSRGRSFGRECRRP